MSLIHHPVYLPFERKVICAECQIYYACKECIRVCRRTIPDTTNFVYSQHDCKGCFKRIKVLLCGICNNIKCKGECRDWKAI